MVCLRLCCRVSVLVHVIVRIDNSHFASGFDCSNVCMLLCVFFESDLLMYAHFCKCLFVRAFVHLLACVRCFVRVFFRSHCIIVVVRARCSFARMCVCVQTVACLCV